MNCIFCITWCSRDYSQFRADMKNTKGMQLKLVAAANLEVKQNAIKIMELVGYRMWVGYINSTLQKYSYCLNFSTFVTVQTQNSLYFIGILYDQQVLCNCEVEGHSYLAFKFLLFF